MQVHTHSAISDFKTIHYLGLIETTPFFNGQSAYGEPIHTKYSAPLSTITNISSMHISSLSILYLLLFICLISFISSHTPI